MCDGESDQNNVMDLKWDKGQTERPPPPGTSAC